MSEPTLQDCINYMLSQIKQMEKHPRNYEFNLPYYRKTVELLEKAQRPHGEWIPCSERLPQDDKEVLVYVRRKDGEKSDMNGLHIARKHQMEGDPEGNKNFWGIPVAPCEWSIEGWSYFFEPEVLAWMPLPEPYKKEGEPFLIGYTGEPCTNCGRYRVEKWSDGLRICEKCGFCIEKNDFYDRDKDFEYPKEGDEK